MNDKIKTFLMFDGKAEEAMNLYVSLFDKAEIKHISRYKEGEAGKAGIIMQAAFSLNGQEFMCIDSSIQHNFTFTPAISIYVNCGSEEEIHRLFTKLSENGKVLMPLDDYGFSKKFGWLEDRFGVSWQLNF